MQRHWRIGVGQTKRTWLKSRIPVLHKLHTFPLSLELGQFAFSTFIASNFIRNNVQKRRIPCSRFQDRYRWATLEWQEEIITSHFSLGIQYVLSNCWLIRLGASFKKRLSWVCGRDASVPSCRSNWFTAWAKSLVYFPGSEPKISVCIKPFRESSLLFLIWEPHWITLASPCT